MKKLNDMDQIELYEFAKSVKEEKELLELALEEADKDVQAQKVLSELVARELNTTKVKLESIELAYNHLLMRDRTVTILKNTTGSILACHCGCNVFFDGHETTICVACGEKYEN